MPSGADRLCSGGELRSGHGEIRAELKFLVPPHRLLGRLDQVGVAPPLTVALRAGQRDNAGPAPDGQTDQRGGGPRTSRAAPQPATGAVAGTFSAWSCEWPAAVPLTSGFLGAAGFQVALHVQVDLAELVEG